MTRPGVLTAALLVAALLALAFPGWLAAPARGQSEGSPPAGSPAPDAALTARARRMAEAMSRDRGLSLPPVDVRIVPARRIRDSWNPLIDQAYEPGDLALRGRVLATLGLLDARDGFRDLLLDVLAAGGDLRLHPRSLDLWLREGLDPAAQERALAHGLAHRFQAEAMDLDSLLMLDPRDLDASLARVAAVEAEARFLDMGGASAQPAQPEGAAPWQWSREALQRLRQAAGPEADPRGPLMHDLSRWAGAGWAASAWADGGWDGLQAAAFASPRSCEQLLYPDKTRGRGDRPSRFPVSWKPTGWSAVASDTLGEILVRAWWATGLADAEALAASVGWDGDRWWWLVRGEDPLGAEEASGRPGCVVWLSDWDSIPDAVQAEQALGAVMDRRFAGGERRSIKDVALWERPGSWTVAAGRRGMLVAAVLGDGSGAGLADGSGAGLGDRLSAEQAAGLVEAALVMRGVVAGGDLAEAHRTRALERDLLRGTGYREKDRMVAPGLSLSLVPPIGWRAAEPAPAGTALHLVSPDGQATITVLSLPAEEGLTLDKLREVNLEGLRKRTGGFRLVEEGMLPAVPDGGPPDTAAWQIRYAGESAVGETIYLLRAWIRDRRQDWVACSTPAGIQDAANEDFDACLGTLRID